MRKLLSTGIAMNALILCGIASAQPKSDVPPNYEQFQKLSFAQMKALPDYKWPSDKKVTEHDIGQKSETELILLRNSIYAQHGFRFSEKALANYFLSRSWYKPEYESLNIDKLPPVSRENVKFFMKAQASLIGGRRDTASESEEVRYLKSQVAYNLFLMGFCSYDTKSEKKAGLIIFDPNGKARVFHSAASRAAFEPYAYEGYLDGVPGAGNETLLIDAMWSIRTNGTKASVIVTIAKDVADMYVVDKKALIPAGDREVLSVDMNKNGNDRYPFTKTRQCQMSFVKP